MARFLEVQKRTGARGHATADGWLIMVSLSTEVSRGTTFARAFGRPAAPYLPISRRCIVTSAAAMPAAMMTSIVTAPPQNTPVASGVP